MYNKKIRKLYEENYTAPVFQSIREFNNPFFIPSEQVLLNKILTNINNGIPLYTKQGILPSTSSQLPIQAQPTKTTSPPSNPPLSSDITDGTNDEVEDEENLDPSVSDEADYYQNEVYKQPGTRFPYSYDEIIDRDLGDERHLIAYNKKDDTLHIAHRGTDSISDVVTDLLAQRFFRIGDTKNIDFEDLSDFSTEKENIKYHIDIFEKAIDKYGKDVKVIFSGHSKGAYDLQTVVNYLENGYKGLERKYTADDIDYNAYLYNGYPFQFEGENTNLKIHPRRIEGDLVSFPYGRNHPNLKTLVLPDTTTTLQKHNSDNFVNRDMSIVPSQSNLKEFGAEINEKDEKKFLALNLMSELDKDNIEEGLDKRDQFYNYDKLEREINILEKLIDIKKQYKLKKIPTGLQKKLKGVKSALSKENEKFIKNRNEEL